ncbi:hypothetical protein B9G69_011960 [Bdellovibrio sp. SKB1291214]|uniref:hypothetical protein n=1 Tax=Bdellovibrio sp. SKB1291214 TaxID=1732569 RepID=UPI000B51E136|nr:hypothetical protein [Bdellovibrio sp. SKB1291214]UYL07761.1 hypothetical protein B9G69_011960 [Bdellovibrio sp. SKB1291214]
MSSHVFLTEVADFPQAQVVKSFLVAQGFHPRLRDEQTRAVAPHLEQFLGKLIIDIPQDEFLEASAALESLQDSKGLKIAGEEDVELAKDQALTESQNMAKKCLVNAVLGCLIIPVVCNLYSMILGFRVLGKEMPLSRLSRTRLVMAFFFNCAGFYIWLSYGPAILRGFMAP